MFKRGLKIIFFFFLFCFIISLPYSVWEPMHWLGERSQCERLSERVSSWMTQSSRICGTETRDGHCDHLSFIELHNLFMEFAISIATYKNSNVTPEWDNLLINVIHNERSCLHWRMSRSLSTLILIISPSFIWNDIFRYL